MYVPRPSIMNRPVRQDGGQANVENAEREYEKTQARLAAKAIKQASHEERMIGAFYALPDEKRRGWCAGVGVAAAGAASVGWALPGCVSSLSCVEMGH